MKVKLFSLKRAWRISSLFSIKGYRRLKYTYGLEWFPVTPIPGEPRPPPRSSGSGWGRGELFKIFGDGVGTGEGKFLGFFRGKNPENRRFLGRGRGTQYRGLGEYFGDWDNPNFGGNQGNFRGFPEESPKFFLPCKIQMCTANILSVKVTLVCL